MLGDHWSAEDALQQALLKAYAGLDDLKDRSKFRPWLTRILVNICLNHRRSLRRHVSLGETDPPADPHLPAIELTELQEQVRAAVQLLPPKQRMALVLRTYEGCSFERIAELMGTTPDAARMNAALARRKLRELLGPTMGEEAP